MAAELRTHPAPASEVPGAPPGTVTLGLTLAERLEGAAEGSQPVLPPRVVDAAYGVILGIFGVILVATAASTFIRNLYFLVTR